MTRWEYLMIMGTARSEQELGVTQAKLNELGSVGWELVAASVMPGNVAGGLAFTFRRSLAPEGD